MRAILLTRDKKAIRKTIDSNRNDWEFRKSVYILEPGRVQNYKEDFGAISGSELIFFEENPNPLSYESDPEDLSADYLDDVVIINFIQQTTDTVGKWNMPGLGFLGWFFEAPSRIPMSMMFGYVIYIIIKNQFFGGGI